MARRPIESQLYQELRECEFSFLGTDPVHILKIYEEVKSRYPNLCDDEYLCCNCCKHGNNQPEWMHVVRGCIAALKTKNIAVQGENHGEWIFNPVDTNKQNFIRRKSKSIVNEDTIEVESKKRNWFQRFLLWLGIIRPKPDNIS